MSSGWTSSATAQLIRETKAVIERSRVWNTDSGRQHLRFLLDVRSASRTRASTLRWSISWASRLPSPAPSAYPPGCTLPGRDLQWLPVHQRVSDSPMCGLGWKSLGVLELDRAAKHQKEYWVPEVQEVDALWFRAASPLYLCHWMRESGLADLLPSLRADSLRRHERRSHGRHSRLQRTTYDDMPLTGSEGAGTG